MIKMLHREEELRKSDEILAKFGNPDKNAIHVAAEVQEQVVREFFFPDVEDMVEIMRAAPAVYPECPEIRNIPHYLKFNRSRDGELKCGDEIPDATLAKLSGIPISLYGYIDSYFGKKKPIVICAGSYT